MERADKAVDLKHNGCNCCQAVLMAYADELNVPEETLKKMGAAFGAGMGCAEGTCGALCGAQMVFGLKTFRGERNTPTAKRLMEEFERRVGATKCEDIRGDLTGKPTCSCADAVRYAAQIAEEYILD